MRGCPICAITCYYFHSKCCVFGFDRYASATITWRHVSHESFVALHPRQTHHDHTAHIQRKRSACHVHMLQFNHTQNTHGVTMGECGNTMPQSKPKCCAHCVKNRATCMHGAEQARNAMCRNVPPPRRKANQSAVRTV